LSVPRHVPPKDRFVEGRRLPDGADVDAVAGWHWLALDEKSNLSAEDLKKWSEKRIAMNFGRVPLPDSQGALLQADGASFVVDREGNLWWAKGNIEIARLSPQGEVTLHAPALKETAEKFGGIKGLACGPDGSLFATCPSAILKITSRENVTAIVHPIVLKDVDTDLPTGTQEDKKPFLRGLAVDPHGTVYAAATGCRCVVRVTPDGRVEVVLKAERPWSPTVGAGPATRHTECDSRLGTTASVGLRVGALGGSPPLDRAITRIATTAGASA
jgi:hypothetical protein